MESRRLLGIASLLVLILLCFFCLEAAPAHWGSMPPMIDVVENIGAYEGKTVCVDGVVLAKSGGSVLSPDPVGALGGLPIEAGGGLPPASSAVHACGKITGGILLVGEVRAHPGSLSLDVFLDVLGLVVFIFFALKEWRIVPKPMFISPKKDA